MNDSFSLFICYYVCVCVYVCHRVRVRAFPLGVSNAKYLTFGTPNTKKPLSLGVLNAKIFGIDEQCNLKFESVLFMNCKTFIIIFICGGPRQMWDFFFLFLINSSLSPLSSHSSLSCPPLSLSLHTHFLPLLSSIYSADLELLLCRRSCLKPPISPRVADLA